MEVRRRLARFWATNVAIAGCINSTIDIGRACRKLFTHGACFKKLPFVTPVSEASRYEGSKSFASENRSEYAIELG